LHKFTAFQSTKFPFLEKFSLWKDQILIIYFSRDGDG